MLASWLEKLMRSRRGGGKHVPRALDPELEVRA
jgi:hypothetical protein